MARLIAFFVASLLALCAGNALAQAAYLHNLNGSATATVGGVERALHIGDRLNSGTTVSTGERSTAVIKFEDGEVMVLAERSSFRIVEYRYNKRRVADSSAVFSLLRGGLRFISGMIGATNRNNFRLTAGSATIGIRGTSAVVTYDALTQAVLAAVSAGSIEMVTPQGSVVIGVGNFSTFAPGQPPSVPAPTAQASSAVAQALANLITVAVPINTPAVLEASATAAAAVAQARLLAAQAAADPDNAALQLAALDAARLAQEAVLAAILAAQGAYDEALDGGGVKYDPDPASILDSDTAAAVQQLITPTGSSSSGSGGTSCGVSCN